MCFGWVVQQMVLVRSGIPTFCFSGETWAQNLANPQQPPATPKFGSCLTESDQLNQKGDLDPAPLEIPLQSSSRPELLHLHLGVNSHLGVRLETHCVSPPLVIYTTLTRYLIYYLDRLHKPLSRGKDIGLASRIALMLIIT